MELVNQEKNQNEGAGARSNSYEELTREWDCEIQERQKTEVVKDQAWVDPD